MLGWKSWLKNLLFSPVFGLLHKLLLQVHLFLTWSLYIYYMSLIKTKWKDWSAAKDKLRDVLPNWVTAVASSSRSPYRCARLEGRQFKRLRYIRDQLCETVSEMCLTREREVNYWTEARQGPNLQPEVYVVGDNTRDWSKGSNQSCETFTIIITLQDHLKKGPILEEDELPNRSTTKQTL